MELVKGWFHDAAHFLLFLFFFFFFTRDKTTYYPAFIIDFIKSMGNLISPLSSTPRASGITLLPLFNQLKQTSLHTLMFPLLKNKIQPPNGA